MTAKELRTDFIKVWLGDLPEYEKMDGAQALKVYSEQLIQEFIEYFRPDIYSEDEKKEWAEKFLKEKL